MRYALKVAENALEIGEVPVGAVIVLDINQYEHHKSSQPTSSSAGNRHNGNRNVPVQHVRSRAVDSGCWGHTTWQRDPEMCLDNLIGNPVPGPFPAGAVEIRCFVQLRFFGFQS